MRKNSFYKKYIKRFLDIILSLLAIIVLSPVLLILAVLIKINLGSPIIFKQRRPGLHGEVFTIYKFRTMTDETDKNGELLPDSKRLTKFGKFIRDTSLDELPELLNILKGEMSLVGPRPLSVKYLPYYNEHEKKRHHVRPGLTGLAQVNGRNNTKWEERFEYDVEYVNQLSFLLDVKIILRTIRVALKRQDVVVRGTGQLEDFHIYRQKQNKLSDAQ